jgi:hypothetical protein
MARKQSLYRVILNNSNSKLQSSRYWMETISLYIVLENIYQVTNIEQSHLCCGQIVCAPGIRVSSTFSDKDYYKNLVCYLHSYIEISRCRTRRSFAW